jgi:hypothetical protein
MPRIKIFGPFAMIAQSAKFIKQLIQGDALPAYVIFREPAVVISYFEDFIKHRDAILRALGGSKPHLLFQFGWHRETQERADEVALEAAEVSRLRPEAEMIFLCNSERETALIAGVGLRAAYCHQNAFLDEGHYRIYDRPIKYDAIYPGGPGGGGRGCRQQGCCRQAYRDVFTASPARRHPARMTISRSR